MEAKFGDKDVSETKRLKTLEDENTKLKRFLRCLNCPHFDLTVGLNIRIGEKALRSFWFA